MTNAVPCDSESRTMASNTSSAVCESRLPVGSSASTQAGLVPEARAQAHFGEDLRRLRSRLVGRHAPDQEWHRHVLDRGELRQQVVELVDEAERAVAHAAALDLAHLAERLALDEDAARGG